MTAADLVVGAGAGLLRATLLMGGAWAFAATLRKAGASAAARHTAWLFGIAALLVLPLLRWLGPILRLPILPAEIPSAAAPLGAIPPGSPSEGSGTLLLVVYALGVGILLLRLVIGRRMLARLWREALGGKEPWERLVASLSSEIGLRRRVELRIARLPVMPMTWGTLAPRMLLPPEAATWSLERRRLVLLHELAHVARRDSLSRSVASLACALYWFHPGIWLAARQMRLEQEHAADDRVLAAGGSAQAYARNLLHLAKGIGEALQPGQAAAMVGICQLERRLASITGPARRDRPSTIFLSSSALLAAFATLIVAASVPVSQSATFLGSLQPQASGVAARADAPADAAPNDVLGINVRSLAHVSAPAQFRRLAREGATVSVVRLERPPSEVGRTTWRGPNGRSGPSGKGNLASMREEASGNPSAASPPQLHDYGWQLPQPGLNVAGGSLADSPRANRLATPPPVYAAPTERAASPKWMQMVPRFVPTAPPGADRGGSRTRSKLAWVIGIAAP